MGASGGEPGGESKSSAMAAIFFVAPNTGEAGGESPSPGTVDEVELSSAEPKPPRPKSSFLLSVDPGVGAGRAVAFWPNPAKPDDAAGDACCPDPPKADFCSEFCPNPAKAGFESAAGFEPNAVWPKALVLPDALPLPRTLEPNADACFAGSGDAAGLALWPKADAPKPNPVCPTPFCAPKPAKPPPPPTVGEAKADGVDGPAGLAD